MGNTLENLIPPLPFFLSLQEAVRSAVTAAADASADADQLRSRLADTRARQSDPTGAGAAGTTTIAVPGSTRPFVIPTAWVLSGAASQSSPSPSPPAPATATVATRADGVSGVFGPLGMTIDAATGRPVANQFPLAPPTGTGIGMPAFAAAWAAATSHAPSRRASEDEGREGGGGGGGGEEEERFARAGAGGEEEGEEGEREAHDPVGALRGAIEPHVFRVLLTNGAIFLKHRKRGPPRQRCV